MAQEAPARPARRQRLTGRLREITGGPTRHNLAGAVAIQGALLVSGVLSARMLGPTNRGYLALLTTFASTLVQLGAVGISLSATYHLASRRIHGHQILPLLRRPAAAQLAGLTAAYTLIAVSYTLIADAPILAAALVGILQIPASLLADYGIALALGARRHALASALRAVAPVALAVLVTLLFVADAGTLLAVECAVVASALLGGALAFARGAKAAGVLRADSSLLDEMEFAEARRELLSFGRRGYVGYLSPTDSFRLDQLAVGLLLSPAALGIYVVGAAFTNFPRLVALNVGLSSTAEIASIEPGEAQRSAIRRAVRRTALLLTAISIGLAAVIPLLIPLLFGSEFSDAVAVGEVLIVAAWFMCMKRVSVDLLRGAGELTQGTRAEAINLIVFLALGIPAGLVAGEVAVAAGLAVAGFCGFAYLVTQMRRLGLV